MCLLAAARATPRDTPRHTRHSESIMRQKLFLALALGLPLVTGQALAVPHLTGINPVWTYDHAVNGQTSEISAFDASTNSLWVVGVNGVDILNAGNGSFIGHIDTTAFGGANSVAIHGGLAAVAIESGTRTDNGVVKLFDTSTRALASGINSIEVGPLPDMLTFTPDGARLLVANEGTPNKTDYGIPALDPAGSVSIIDMTTRGVIATAGFTGVATTGSAIRTNTGMDFEPEYIAVSRDGKQAFVTLQEANAIGILELNSNSFSKVVGLGLKDFGSAGNAIDPSHKDSKIELRASLVKGLYQPDAIAAYQSGGQTYLVMANEGDTREDDGDKERVKDAGLAGYPDDLKQLNISLTDSSDGNLVTFGGRSFSIRDAEGNLVFDSGNELDAMAIALGIYDDGRSDDKGVEPEGVEVVEIDGVILAFIGLERTTQSAVGIYDITDPENVRFLDMLVSEDDLSPEGLEVFSMDGAHYLAVTNEVSGTTSVFQFGVVPEPGSVALSLLGLGLLGAMKVSKSPRRRT